jgi:hypothetical protein
MDDRYKVILLLLLFVDVISGNEESYGYELTQTINIQRQGM